MTYTYPNYQPNYPTWNQPYMPPQMGIPVQQPQVPTYPAYTSITGPNPVRGKVIADFSELMPNDVPMDGFDSIFPTTDGSRIYVQRWENGNVVTKTYVPEGSTNNFENDVMQGIADIKSLLNQRTHNKQRYPKQNGGDSNA